MGSKPSKPDPIKSQIESIYVNLHGEHRISALEKLLENIDYNSKYKNLIIGCIANEQNKIIRIG